MPNSVALQILQKYGLADWVQRPYVYAAFLCGGNRIYVRLKDIGEATFRSWIGGLKLSTKPGGSIFNCNGGGSIEFSSVKTDGQAKEVAAALSALGADLTR